MTLSRSTRRHFGPLAAAMLLLAALGHGSTARAQDATDPKSIALSQQLLDLAGAKDQITRMLDQIMPSLIQLVQQANPGKEAEVAEVMDKFVVPRMKESLPDALQDCAAVYANHFSRDELSQLIAFYQSPLGRKLVAEQPAMAQELARLGAGWAQKAAVQAMHDYADEFKKRGLDTPI